MVGAPVLAARAALRAGVGLATTASTAKVVELIDRDIEEVMTLVLPSWNEVVESAMTIEAFVKDRHVSVIVIGPGLPAVADRAIRAFLANIRLPLVIDAEALTALSGHLSVLKDAANMNRAVILTPHSEEYARLIKDEPVEGEGRILAGEFAQRYGITLVLKHHHTTVASALGMIYENKTGNPGMATAGAGDVLSGIIAGILAQGVRPYKAAKMAVYLHGIAGDIAQGTKTEPGMIASDIIEAIPEAFRLLDN